MNDQSGRRSVELSFWHALMIRGWYLESIRSKSARTTFSGGVSSFHPAPILRSGASPRTRIEIYDRARRAGDSVSLLLGCRPLRGLNRFRYFDPGACAPGFMLTPAIAG